MKVTSKAQFNAIQYTSIEVIRGFLEPLGVEVVTGEYTVFGSSKFGGVIRAGQWLVYDGSIKVLSDKEFKERYAEPLTKEEKDFIAQALTHVTSSSDDIRTRVEDNARIARVKQQILDKL